MKRRKTNVNLLDINKHLRPIVEDLSKNGNKENIVVLDDNIVLYITSQEDNSYENKPLNNKRKSKINLKNYRIKEEVNFLIFTKDGLLFGEEVNLVASMLNKNGDLAGYMFRLAYVKEKPNNLDNSEVEQRKLNDALVFYINEEILDSIDEVDNLNIDELYFTGNDIDNEIIENSLCEIYQDIELVNYGTSYIMKYKNIKYRYSSEVCVINSNNRLFTNIGKFIPI